MGMGAIELRRKVWEGEQKGDGENCTCVLGRTHAGVVVDSVDTGGIVLTVVVLAVVDVDLTFVAFETLRTHTPEDHTQVYKHISREKSNTNSLTHSLCPCKPNIHTHILSMHAANNSSVSSISTFPVETHYAVNVSVPQLSNFCSGLLRYAHIPCTL